MSDLDVGVGAVSESTAEQPLLRQSGLVTRHTLAVPLPVDLPVPLNVALAMTLAMALSMSLTMLRTMALPMSLSMAGTMSLAVALRMALAPPPMEHRVATGLSCKTN